MDKKIKCLKVEPGLFPEIAQVDAGLESLQKEVSGMIQAVYPFDDPVAIVCNEEGKLMNLPENRALYDEEGNLYDVICGTFLVVGLGEDDFASLSDELLAKYCRYFGMQDYEHGYFPWRQPKNLLETEERNDAETGS